jgi:hypothetical protein
MPDSTQSTRSRILSRPFYLLLLPAFFMLHNTNKVFGFISILQVALFAVAVITIQLVVYWVVGLFCKTRQFTAATSFVLLLPILYFGPLHDFAKSNVAFLSRYIVFLPLLSVFILVAVAILKTNRIRTFAGYANVILISLVAFESVKLLSNIISPPANTLQHTPVCGAYKPTQSQQDRPDIFVLMFDEYTSNEELKKNWGFDNSAISGWLRERGFFVADSSFSNYNSTPFSISSFFNMNYIDPEVTRNRERRHILQAVRSISENETTCILKKEGYRLVFIAPFEKHGEDAQLHPEFAELAWKQFSAHTIFSRLNNDIMWNFGLYRPLIPPVSAEGNFLPTTVSLPDKVEEIKRTRLLLEQAIEGNGYEQPKFVYLHSMVTHPPHVVDSTGRLNASMPSDAGGRFRSYPYQVEYANDMIRSAVDSILAKGKRKKVIMVLGDHGYRSQDIPAGREEFANFFAVYFSDRHSGQAYATISPVNAFRLVFNHYFYQNLPLLKDTSIPIKY